jgi:hypothetical protein
MRHLLCVFGVVGASLGLGGCWGNESSPFPGGLDPLDPVNRAAPPAPVAGDPHPETFNAVYGEDDRYAWGHLRGFVHAPIAAVWAAVKDPLVVADRRTDSHVTWQLGVEPSYDYSYQLRYHVDGTISVDWNEDWRYGVVAGTDAAPQRILNRAQKIWGTTFIDVDANSMRIEPVDESTTTFEAEEHLKATASGPDTIEQYYKDLWASLCARVHGQPLPTY